MLMPQAGNQLTGGELSALLGQMNAVVHQNQVLANEVQNLGAKVVYLSERGQRP